MSFLLDTNAVSEWVKPRPNAGLMGWLADADEDRIYLSVVTIAEIRHGIERLPASRRRARLDEWLSNELTVLAVRRDSPTLSAQINAVIDAMKADGRMEKLYAQWF